MNTIADRAKKPCYRCGGSEFTITPHDYHPAKRTCVRCGFHDWMPKEKNLNKRPATNWMGVWRKQGELHCHWCWVKEDETTAFFVIDHIHSLEDGGADDFINTRPLCADCHTKRTAERAHVRHIQGKSARNEGTHNATSSSSPINSDTTLASLEMGHNSAGQANESTIPGAQPNAQSKDH